MAKNGNGSNGHGVKFAIPPTSVKTDVDGRLVIDDLVPASVLLMFFVQKLGKASTAQIATKVEAASVVMNPHLLEQAIESLQARQFVSYAKGKNPEGGVVDQWKPRKANFSGVPDVAQVSYAFLSNLVTTPDAEELIASLNESEEEGDGTKKATEKLKYADYYAMTATFKTCDSGGAHGALLGGHPSSAFYDAIVRKGPACPKECDLRFPRDGEGRPEIPVSNVRGWLRGLLRKYVTPAAVDYISIQGGRIEFEGKIEQYAHQVVDLSGGARGGGRGITTYEAIAAGARVTFYFVVPKRGVGSYEQFKYWLMVNAPCTVRGLSNARSNEFGFVQLVDAKFLGPLEDAHSAVATVLDRLDPEARAFAEASLADLGGRKLNLKSGNRTEVD